MGDVVKFARPEVPPEMSLADRIRIRMLAGELNKMADDIDAGSGEGYDECVVVFSDYATGDLLYDSNIDDPYRIAGILLRSANHAANGDE